MEVVTPLVVELYKTAAPDVVKTNLFKLSATTIALPLSSTRLIIGVQLFGFASVAVPAGQTVELHVSEFWFAETLVLHYGNDATPGTTIVCSVILLVHGFPVEENG